MDLQTKVFSRSLGAEVTNHKGECLGKVIEIKKDSTEKIEYVVICSSELFGNVNRYFAIPACSSLIKITRDGRIMLYIDKESLQISIGVDARDCPKINPEFSDSILELYHYESSKNHKLNIANGAMDSDEHFV